MTTKKAESAPTTLRQRAEEFFAKRKTLTRAARKAAFAALPDKATQLLAREMVTTRERGFRHVNGRIELSKTRLADEIARLKAKRDEYATRAQIINSKIAEYEAEYAERFEGETE
jgi:hypothetical protein